MSSFLVLYSGSGEPNPENIKGFLSTLELRADISCKLPWWVYVVLPSVNPPSTACPGAHVWQPRLVAGWLVTAVPRAVQRLPASFLLLRQLPKYRRVGRGWWGKWRRRRNMLVRTAQSGVEGGHPDIQCHFLLSEEVAVPVCLTGQRRAHNPSHLPAHLEHELGKRHGSLPQFISTWSPLKHLPLSWAVVDSEYWRLKQKRRWSEGSQAVFCNTCFSSLLMGCVRIISLRVFSECASKCELCQHLCIAHVSVCACDTRLG